MKYDDAAMKKVIADPRYSDVGNLPSNFFPYPELVGAAKKIYARPFTVDELRLIGKAAVLKDMSHMIRAIDLCVTMDAGNLTIGDFYYMMMWLRLYSMPKAPYIMDWPCQEVIITSKKDGSFKLNDASFKMPEPEDEDNWEPRPCGAHNTEIIHLIDMHVVSLEDDFEGIPQTEAIEFDFPRARYIQDIDTCMKDPGLRLLAGPASWVKDGETIEEKLAILQTQNDLSAFDAAAHLNETIIHGVGENANLTCRKCLKVTPHAISLDPFSFFR